MVGRLDARRFAVGASGYVIEVGLPAFAVAVLAIFTAESHGIEQALAGAAAAAALGHAVLSLAKLHRASQHVRQAKVAMAETSEAIERAGRTTLAVLDALKSDVIPAVSRTLAVATPMTADRRLSASVRGRAGSILASSEQALAALEAFVRPSAPRADVVEPAYVVMTPAAPDPACEPVEASHEETVMGAPAADAPAYEDQAYEAEPIYADSPPVAAMFTLEGLRVLVGEANGVHQLVLRTHLAQLGAEAEFFNDGIEVMEAWREGGWDLVMLDVQMPRMDGLAATQMIRSVEARFGWSSTPIVALAPNDSEAQMLAAAEAGMSAFVAKPIDGAALFAAIEAAFAAPLDAPAIEESPFRMARVA